MARSKKEGKKKFWDVHSSRCAFVRSDTSIFQSLHFLCGDCAATESKTRWLPRLRYAFLGVQLVSVRKRPKSMKIVSNSMPLSIHIQWSSDHFSSCDPVLTRISPPSLCRGRESVLLLSLLLAV